MRISDWSSDVCSSDLPTPPPNGSILNGRRGGRAGRCRRCFGKTETASKKQRRLGIERPDQPSSGTAREGERPALANGRRHGDPVRLAHDRRIVALGDDRSEEHKSELQPLMRTASAVFCVHKKTNLTHTPLPCPTLTDI